MTVLRPLAAVLEHSKQEVLDMTAVLDEHGLVEPKSALRQAAPGRSSSIPSRSRGAPCAPAL